MSGFLHNHGRGANNRTAGRHITIDNNGFCTYPASIADSDRTKYRCVRSDEDVISNGRVPFSPVLAGAAERDSMKHDAIFADLCRLSYDNAKPVVTEEVPADPCTRMYFHGREESHDL